MPAPAKTETDLSRATVAALLGVSPSRASQLVAAGKLQAGAKGRVTVASLAALLAAERENDADGSVAASRKALLDEQAAFTRSRRLRFERRLVSGEALQIAIASAITSARAQLRSLPGRITGIALTSKSPGETQAKVAAEVDAALAIVAGLDVEAAQAAVDREAPGAVDEDEALAAALQPDASA